jgi:hypothetical protein
MPVVMAVILIGVPLGLGLGGIVDAAVVAGRLAGLGRVGGHDGAALLQMQVDMALQADGKAKVASRREENHSAARGRRRFDGLVDGATVSSVLPSPVAPYLRTSKIAHWRHWRLFACPLPQPQKKQREWRQPPCRYCRCAENRADLKMGALR